MARTADWKRMSIKEELQAELTDAMRNKDRRRLDVIRQVHTEVSRARSAPGFSGEVSDELYRQVIGSYVKQMGKALEEYRQAGERGWQMAEKLAFEIDYLERWLPETLDEEATRALVRQTLENVDVSHGPGPVIGGIMTEHGEKVDGGLVNRLVREELSARE